MIAFSSAPRLEHWFVDVFRPLKPKLKSPATVEDYQTLIRHFSRFLTERDAQRGVPREAATPADLTDVNIGGYMLWKSQQPQGNTPATVNKHRRYLLSLARVAKRKGFLSELPEIDRLAEYDRMPECWSIEEMGAILAAAEEEPGMVGECPARLWWPAIIWFVFNTGFRISAVMSVKSCDVDLERAQVIVRAEQQKDKADQPIDLLAETIAALRAINFHHLDRVFDDWKYDRGTRQWKVLNKRLKGILARAGLSAGRRDLWHKFRRVFVTYIAAASDLHTASQMAGHSHVRITKKYVDPRKLNSARASQLLPRVPIARQLKLFTG